MVILLLLLAVTVASNISEARGAAASELFEDVNFDALSQIDFDERTFVNLNSTYLAYGVATGAVLVLMLGAGLYLYDYYYGTSRTDPVEGYNQYYTDQEAYNQYLYQQAQYQSRRYLLFF